MNDREAFDVWALSPGPDEWWGLSERERLFLAWQAATDAAQAEIDKLQAQLVRQQASYEAEIKVEIDAALERAAEICDRAEIFAWEQWIATGNQHNEGVSDGAASLARDIRALKDKT